MGPLHGRGVDLTTRGLLEHGELAVDRDPKVDFVVGNGREIHWCDGLQSRPLIRAAENALHAAGSSRAHEIAWMSVQLVPLQELPHLTLVPGVHRAPVINVPSLAAVAPVAAMGLERGVPGAASTFFCALASDHQRAAIQESFVVVEQACSNVKPNGTTPVGGFNCRAPPCAAGFDASAYVHDGFGVGRDPLPSNVLRVKVRQGDPRFVWDTSSQSSTAICAQMTGGRSQVTSPRGFAFSPAGPGTCYVCPLDAIKSEHDIEQFVARLLNSSESDGLVYEPGCAQTDSGADVNSGRRERSEHDRGG